MELSYCTARNSGAGLMTKKRSGGPSCCIGRTARRGKCVATHRHGDRGQRNSEPSESDVAELSAARFCTPANTSTARHEGQERLVIGTGNSGHDIAQDLYSSGSKVTPFSQSTLIVNIEPSGQLPYALYDEGPPLEDCDSSIPPYRFLHGRAQVPDRAGEENGPDLLEGLRRGFSWISGDERLAVQYLTGRRYYFNVVFDLIVAAR